MTPSPLTTRHAQEAVTIASNLTCGLCRNSVALSLQAAELGSAGLLCTLAQRSSACKELRPNPCLVSPLNVLERTARTPPFSFLQTLSLHPQGLPLLSSESPLHVKMVLFIFHPNLLLKGRASPHQASMAPGPTSPAIGDTHSPTLTLQSLTGDCEHTRPGHPTPSSSRTFSSHPKRKPPTTQGLRKTDGGNRTNISWFLPQAESGFNMS